MPPYFDDHSLQQLAEGFASLPRRSQRLAQAFLDQQFVSDAARECAHRGVARRISTIARCIDRVYRILPPELDEVPDRDLLIDATIFIQAFVFNTFGVLDNLAFVWVNEKGVKGRNGLPLPNSRIGLNGDKEEVRLSFSAAMRAYLEQRDPWFSHLENFRHSLGHRVPLYIPPYTVAPDDVARYAELGADVNQASLRGDVTEYTRLRAEQTAIVRFRPWMKHSFKDQTPPIVFHPQILADFATVEEISMKIIGELERYGIARRLMEGC